MKGDFPSGKAGRRGLGGEAGIVIQAGLEDAWIAVRKVRWREAWRDVWGMCLRDLGDWQGSGRSVGEGGVRGGSQASSLALGVLVVQFRDGNHRQSNMF